MNKDCNRPSARTGRTRFRRAFHVLKKLSALEDSDGRRRARASRAVATCPPSCSLSYPPSSSLSYPLSCSCSSPFPNSFPRPSPLAQVADYGFAAGAGPAACWRTREAICIESPYLQHASGGRLRLRRRRRPGGVLENSRSYLH